MSDTPRTSRVEDVIYCVGEVSLHFVKADFARTLERELSAMKSENDELNKLLSEQQANWEKDLKKCSDELARATESSMAGLRREQQRLADELRSVTAERDRMRMLLDCRLCKNYTTKSGGCTSVFTCVDASQFKASEPHRYWIEAAK